MGGVHGTQIFRNVSIPHACVLDKGSPKPYNKTLRPTRKALLLGIQMENCRNPEPG